MNIGDDAQIGEVQATAAGRDMYNGMTPEQLRQTLRDQTEFFTALVTGYERLYKDIHREIDRVEDAARLWHHTFQQRMKADAEQEAKDDAERTAERLRLNKRLKRMERINIFVAVLLPFVAIALLIIIIRLWPVLTALALVS